MSHLSGWFNYEATLKILIFSMLAGAALPGLFALGLRLQAVGAGATGNVSTDGAPPQRKRKNNCADILPRRVHGCTRAARRRARCAISCSA